MLTVLESLENAMNTEQTAMKKNRWVWIIPATITVMVINVAIHILYMVAYSYVINPEPILADSQLESWLPKHR